MKTMKAFYLDKNGVHEHESVCEVSGYFEAPMINVYNVDRQKIIGFGGAFTESAAYNYSLMSAIDKKKCLEYLFGESGLRYNFCRLCIGSSDFALEEYCYVKEQDELLETFSIERDKKYIIPFLKDAMEYTKNKLILFASPWSPPAFMKTNSTRFSGGKLKEEYYNLYAEYLIRFILGYKNEGIEISMLTLQNEAHASQTWESCVFDAEDEVKLAKILSARLKEYNLNVKLLCWDHNKERLYERAVDTFSKAEDAIDGIAFHWYSGDHFNGVDLVYQTYPDKLLLETEFCKSSAEDKVQTRYAKEMANCLSCGTMGICEWNLILDEKGGPYHNRKGGCDAPIRLKPDNTIERSKIYWESYMFSHFIQSGAIALATSSFNSGVYASAVKNPNGEIVVSVVNELNEDFDDCRIYIQNRYISLPIKKETVTTVIFEL